MEIWDFVKKKVIRLKELKISKLQRVGLQCRKAQVSLLKNSLVSDAK